jgi:hypothetical protein
LTSTRAVVWRWEKDDNSRISGISQENCIKIRKDLVTSLDVKVIKKLGSSRGGRRC